MSICVIAYWRKMAKVNLLVKYCLINEKDEYNIKGILINNKIKFLDKNNKMILDLKLNTLKRITDYLEIIFDFNNKICTVIDEKKNKISFDINVLELKNDENYFYVKYKIDLDEFVVMIRII